MFTNNPVRFVLQCAAVAAIALSAPSFAESQVEPRVVIQYTDQDLGSETRVAAFYTRLQSASRGVCRSLKNRDLASVQIYQDCYSKALADAVNAVNQQTLTALHNSPEAKSARAVARARGEKQS
jgi:UrcA family protein